MTDYGTYKAFGRLKWALMHRPEEELDLVMDPDKWGFRSKPNSKEATKEFDALHDALKAEKVKIDLIKSIDVPTPNLYYTRDLGICTRNGLVLANFRAEFRQGEEVFLEVMADKLGIPVFGEVRDAFFEGGDFVQISDSVAALGLSRSSYTGYEEVSNFLDITLLPIPHDHHFHHLDVLFNMVREDLALVCVRALPIELTDYLEENSIEIMPVTIEEQKTLSADVLMLEGGKIILGEECVRIKKDLENHGVDVITTKLHELKKGNGGPGCLALSLLRK